MFLTGAVSRFPDIPDEEAFQEKFMGFAKDNLRESEELGKIKSSLSGQEKSGKHARTTDLNWESLESVLEVRTACI